MNNLFGTKISYQRNLVPNQQDIDIKFKYGGGMAQR